ncbi:MULTISPECIES: MFS transporter [Clostridium]|uniref:Hexuronate transporter n=1 Tax=Clostridium ragsdalei P11 TaxID=1353534 RepID=A0A1A6AIC4_9CLOT|nr:MULTISPECIES: MFS transporter [Clostridium]OBR89801.1 hexuronate transporter [Clostridium ragsdalei P11]QXE19677.1 MFS transporter [Clostridium sp. 001]
MQTNTCKRIQNNNGYYKYSWAILIIMICAYFVDMFMRYNIPTVIPTLMKTYKWDAATVGWVDSSYLWAYALMQMPWAYISERWLGARWTITVGTGLIVFSSIVFAFNISNLGVGIVARALIGAGAAAIWVPANPMLARWFAPSHRGLQTGILGIGGTLGTFVGGACMPALLSSFCFFGLPNIQSGFLLSALPGLLILFIVPNIIKNRPEEIGLVSLDNQTKTKQTDNEPTIGYIMKHSPYPYIMGIVYAGFLGTQYFVFTWFATYLGKVYMVNVKSAALLWALSATLPSVISQPLSGMISDKIGHKKATSAALLLAATFSLVFVFIASMGNRLPLAVTMTVMVLFALFVNMWVLAWPFTTMMFPTKAGAVVGGFMNTVAQLVGAAAPVISGYIIRGTNSYVGVFALGAVCALSGFIASLFLKEHRVV